MADAFGPSPGHQDADSRAATLQAARDSRARTAETLRTQLAAAKQETTAAKEEAKAAKEAAADTERALQKRAAAGPGFAVAVGRAATQPGAPC